MYTYASCGMCFLFKRLRRARVEIRLLHVQRGTHRWEEDLVPAPSSKHKWNRSGPVTSDDITPLITEEGEGTMEGGH